MRSQRRGLRDVIIVVLALFAKNADAFLPGVKPRSYPVDSPIEIRAQSLASSLPGQVAYPFSSLPFCKPHQVSQEIASLGEILFGDVTENTAINATTARSMACSKLCTVKLARADREFLDELITNRYNYRLLADDLPGLGSHAVLPNSTLRWYSTSVPVGSIVRTRNMTGQAKDAQLIKIVNNAIKLTIDLAYDDSTAGNFFIHDFAISVTSSDSTNDGLQPQIICEEETPGRKALVLSPQVQAYDVTLQIDFNIVKDVGWTTRWDRWLAVQRDGFYADYDSVSVSKEERDTLELIRKALIEAEEQQQRSVRWFSIINSAVVVLLLTSVVGVILLRTLLRDIATYNQVAGTNEAMEFFEESGWKLLHADVFRKPRHFTILSAWVGCGLQLLTMGTALAVLAGLGFISPYFSRSKLVILALAVWSLSGYVAGYTSSRLYGSFQSAVNWRLTTVRTACIWPGIIMLLFVATNSVLTLLSSSAALPISLVGLLAFLWLGVSLPLLLLGSYHGYRHGPISLPVKTGKIPRHITQAELTLTKALKCLFCGIPPFAAVLAEYVYMASAAQQMRSYLFIGFALFSACVLMITCAEISIAMTYMTLSHEDYNWWWPAFFSAASTALYTFAALVIHPLLLVRYAFASMRPAIFLVWVGYAAMTSYSMFVVCGTIGFVASFIFVRAIFSSVKLD